MKSEIIERLGQTDILLPALIQDGLRANDRVKARLSVLQAAGRHARSPDGGAFDLAEECRAAGIEAQPLKALVDHASPSSGERISAPGITDLEDAIWGDVACMAEAARAGDTAAGEAALERMAALRAAAPEHGADTLALSEVDRLTSLSGGAGGDSLHRLVMDLHKVLNRLSAMHAEEEFAGAHVHGLLPTDRPAVEAFMRGVESTRKLKFGHPGLATYAARSGERLTIQNDIGETDAHVVVIAVEAGAVTVTYTDVHFARAKFLAGLFDAFPVQWSGLDHNKAGELGGEAFYLVTGRCAFMDAAGRDAFLEAFGAALVFLIDWNKARKVLRTFVVKSDALHILDWAARSRVGHRGFLALGGPDLVAAAVNHAAPARIGFGEQLDNVLGRKATVDFLKVVLRTSTEALLGGNSVRLARDRIEADLVRRLQRADSTLLAVVVRQAGLAREIAVGIASFVTEQQAGRSVDQHALAAQARRIEEKADRLAVEARSEIERFDGDRSIERLVNHIEEAIDELEQAAFIASLVSGPLAPELLAPLARLCAATLAGTEAAASGVVAASDVPEGHRVDMEDALAAVGRLIEAEHEADAAERAVTTAVLRGDFDMKTALSVLELTRAAERATDRLAGFGHQLREHVLADLSR